MPFERGDSNFPRKLQRTPDVGLVGTEFGDIVWMISILLQLLISASSSLTSCVCHAMPSLAHLLNSHFDRHLPHERKGRSLFARHCFAICQRRRTRSRKEGNPSRQIEERRRPCFRTVIHRPPVPMARLVFRSAGRIFEGLTDSPRHGTLLTKMFESLF